MLDRTMRWPPPASWRRRWSARSTPIWLPVSACHPPRPSGTAAASRSASGSLATISSASTRAAVASARSSAPGSSGLGNATVGKRPSGVNCSSTQVSRVVAGAVERVDDEPAADAVQRGVDDREAPVDVERGACLLDGLEVAPAGEGPELLDVAVGCGLEWDLGGGSDVGDGGGDALVIGRDDLGAVGCVDLVAVVLGRVVARGDDHRRRRAQLLAGEGHERRRCRVREPRDREPGRAEHADGVAREAFRVGARIEPDDDGSVGSVGHRRQDVVGEATRGADHDRPVHPHRSGADDATQPRRAELERPREPLGELVDIVRLEDGLELRDGRRVGVAGEPGAREPAELVGVGRGRGRVVAHGGRG